MSTSYRESQFAQQPSSRRVILHTGYPKAGSTSLQTEIFPHLSNIWYSGKRYERSQRKPSGLRIQQEIPLPCPPKFYDLTAEEAAERLVNEVNIADEPIVLLSEEKFFRQSGVMGPDAVSIERTLEHLQRTANALEKMDVELNLMVSLRKQSDMAASMAAQVFREEYGSKRHKNVEKFWQNFYHILTSRQENAISKFFDYSYILSKMVASFGRKRIFAIPAEALWSAEKPNDIDQFARFMGFCPDELFVLLTRSLSRNSKSRYLDEGVWYTPAPVMGYKFSHAGQIYAYTLRQLFGINPDIKVIKKTFEPFFVSHNETEKIKERFLTTNLFLQEQLPFDLRQYGYFPNT